MKHSSSIAIGMVVIALVAGCKSKSPLPAGAVQVLATEKGFEPSSVTLKRGQPASLVFLRTTDDTCATAVVFPELNVKKDLPKDAPVQIEIPTERDRMLTFQCGMGMYKSAVVVN